MEDQSEPEQDITEADAEIEELEEELHDDYILSAERLAAAAYKLDKQHDRDSQLPNGPTITRYQVVGGDYEEGEYVEIQIRVTPDDKPLLQLPWPENTTDYGEPLVRLADYYGVPIHALPDLNEVLVYVDGGGYADDGEYEIIVPPEPNSPMNKLFQSHPSLFQLTRGEGKYGRNILEYTLSPSVFAVLGALFIGGAVGGALLWLPFTFTAFYSLGVTGLAIVLMSLFLLGLSCLESAGRLWLAD